MADIGSTLESLPDFPALEQLARALWSPAGARGAAAMVGAGFSLNAELKGADVRPPPLWGRVANAMRDALYADAAQAPQDPLRLAEEYRIYFGQAALDDLIREWIPDAGWSPGPLHDALIALPWADILTTNYDTLLERASTDVAGRPYQVVRSDGDLARFSAPRIIKLHGTVGVDDHFVIAEEDFRTYPARRAAFVNVARQIFIENELCLFGFSGDDPNFLAWSGWVRDHLAGNARRIYLIGVLSLSPSKRKLLEARNISPIDLAPAVGHLDWEDRNPRALAMALEYLRSAQPKHPYDWEPTNSSRYVGLRGVEDTQELHKNPAVGATKFREMTKAWAKDRASYPGWLVTPARVRHELREANEQAPFLSEPISDVLGQTEASAWLREIAWTESVGYVPADSEVALRLIEMLTPANASGFSRTDRLEVAAFLLRYAREVDLNDEFERWSAYIRAAADPSSDDLANVAYQAALRARDRLDFETLEGLVEKVAGPDPAWALRRAALHCDLGAFETAEAVVKATLADLRARRRSIPASVWVISRLAWAEWLANAMARDADFKPRPWANDFKAWKSDPFDLIDTVEKEISIKSKKRREQEREIIPGFEAGQYKNPGSTLYFGRARHTSTLHTFSRLLEEAGCPLRLRHYNLTADTLLEAAELSPDATVRWHLVLLRCMDRPGHPRFQDHFSRVAIARLPDSVASGLLDRLFPAAQFWIDRFSRPDRRRTALDRLPLLLETIARLVVRTSVGEANKVIELAFSISAQAWAAHHAVCEPLGRMFRSALSALPKAKRSRWAVAILAFPLPGETGENPHSWPSAGEWMELVGPLPALEGVSSARVDALIDATARLGMDRVEACGRLSRLHDAGLLSDDQSRRWGQNLWAHLDKGSPPLPAGTRFFAFAFASLPCPAEIDPAAVVNQRLYTELQPSAPTHILEEIAATGTHGLRPSPTLPTAEQAALLFDQLVQWRGGRGKADAHERLSQVLSGESDARTATTLARALARTIIPALAPNDRNQARLQALFDLLEEDSVGTAREAVTHFLEGPPSLRPLVVKGLRDGLVSGRFDDVAGACEGVVIWLHRSRDLGLPEQSLLDLLVRQVETRVPKALHVVMRTVRRALAVRLIGPAEVEALKQALDVLHAETAYDAVRVGSMDGVSVSLVRAESVRLASALEATVGPSKETQAWLDVAIGDPLPEVRHALDEGRAHGEVGLD